MSGVSRNDRLSDTESECSVPDLLSRDQIDELDRGNLIRTEQPSEQMTIDQRFSNMNKQISELTGLVLALTEKLSFNPGEGNNQNTASDKTCAHSDINVITSQKVLLKMPFFTVFCHNFDPRGSERKYEHLKKRQVFVQKRNSNLKNVSIET